VPGLDRPDFQGWRRRRLAGAAIVALIGGFLWLAFAAADMSGQPADAFSPSALAGVVSDTDFGKLWALRLAGCAALTLAVWSPRLRWTLAPLGALVLALLAAPPAPRLAVAPLAAGALAAIPQMVQYPASMVPPQPGCMHWVAGPVLIILPFPLASGRV
jgi:putative copper export protein